jgi:hypothetical protein
VNLAPRRTFLSRLAASCAAAPLALLGGKAKAAEPAPPDAGDAFRESFRIRKANEDRVYAEQDRLLAICNAPAASQWRKEQAWIGATALSWALYGGPEYEFGPSYARSKSPTEMMAILDRLKV